jgi:glucosamine--fructose-6-phosphate aminotransferase (isomerizing)
MRECQRKGHSTLAICNVVGSTIAREADGGIYQHVGPEVGVASTKAFTSQLLLGAMLSLYIARMRDMSFSDGTQFVSALKGAPDLVRRVLQQAQHIREIAQRYAHHTDMLFLGRLSLFPIALEGALKLKEISYIHAEGYPAGEMKHGPIALIDEEMPVVAIATQSAVRDKMLSNMQEVKARGGFVVGVAEEKDEEVEKQASCVLRVAPVHEALSPIINIIPLQLLAYYVAMFLGCDVDQPRNLAKSVTVE